MKKGLLALLTVALAFVAFQGVPALAEEGDGGVELNDQAQSGDTEVEAQIVDDAGEVAYIVTVPSKIDFGTLACPDSDADSFTIQKFSVDCVQMLGVSMVKVSVCNDGSTAGEANQDFYLSNQTNGSCTFMPTYEVYVGTTKIDTSAAMPVNGYDYLVFTQEGQSVKGGVRLNQRQLYPYKDDLASIAGSYTGTMVFTTSATEV